MSAAVFLLVFWQSDPWWNQAGWRHRMERRPPQTQLICVGVWALLCSMDLQFPPPLETQGRGLGTVGVWLWLSQTLRPKESHLKQPSPWRRLEQLWVVCVEAHWVQLLLQPAGFTVMQAVSAAWTPLSTVWRRFWAFFTRISSDDLHPGVTAFTLGKRKNKEIYIKL